MKRILSVLLASAAMAGVIAPAASAHERGQYGRQSDWEDRDDSAYPRFHEALDHLYEGIDHGLSDGSIDRRDARRFYRAIDQLREYINDCRGRRGYLNRWQVQDIQSRLDRLHEIMHEVHEEGHEAQDYGYGRYRH